MAKQAMHNATAYPTPDPSQASDFELANRAARGDTQAFEIIMRRHNQLLFRTARSILKSDEETEDALQDAYLNAWRAMGSFRDDARLSTWLARIVINEALGRLRRAGAQVIPLDAANNSNHESSDSVESSIADDPERQPEVLAVRKEMRLLMESRIDRLPDIYRTVFVLRAVQEMSVAETAIALELPEATIRTRFFRARSFLREGLSRDFDIAVGDAFSFDGMRCDRIVQGVLARLVYEHRSPLF
jgi:RNA polymerase sigma-70 factor (ECF subfamily)